VDGVYASARCGGYVVEGSGWLDRGRWFPSTEIWGVPVDQPLWTSWAWGLRMIHVDRAGKQALLAPDRHVGLVEIRARLDELADARDERGLADAERAEYRALAARAADLLRAEGRTVGC
jgi:hypothetical protein